MLGATSTGASISGKAGWGTVAGSAPGNEAETLIIGKSTRGIAATGMKKYATIHHYDLPARVLNYVTKGAYCKDRSCGFVKNKFLDDKAARHDDYMRLMAHASE